MGRNEDWATMDPADWESFRRLAHRMVDDMVDELRDLSETKVWQPFPTESKEFFDAPIPWEGVGDEQAYAEFQEHIFPYTNGNRHPRFFGWVQGNGTPLGMMSDMLAAGMNPHAAGFEQSSTYVEEQVLRWLRELMGFPADGSGALVSGGSMANFIGLSAARDASAGFDIWQEGLQAAERRPLLTFYGSAATHGWAPKTANLLGLGNDSFRRIPAPGDRIDLAALRERVDADRSAGHHPFCVLGTAGTVNTGATDDLEALADFCAETKLWLHVDGAFGAWARLSSTHSHVVRGIERADSLGFDLHKWGYLPFESACVLVREPKHLCRPFAIRGSYLDGDQRGTLAAGLPFAARGLELTRGFKALKIWMSFRSFGLTQFGRLVDQNLAQANRLSELVEKTRSLELLAPCPLNVVCFRYVSSDLPDDALDSLNRELILRVQESGEAVPSGTTVAGRFALRAAIVNHRTKDEDLDRVVRVVVRIGNELERELSC